MVDSADPTATAEAEEALGRTDEEIEQLPEERIKYLDVLFDLIFVATASTYETGAFVFDTAGRGADATRRGARSIRNRQYRRVVKKHFQETVKPLLAKDNQTENKQLSTLIRRGHDILKKDLQEDARIWKQRFDQYRQNYKQQLQSEFAQLKQHKNERVRTAAGKINQNTAAIALTALAEQSAYEQGLPMSQVTPQTVGAQTIATVKQNHPALAPTIDRIATAYGDTVPGNLLPKPDNNTYVPRAVRQGGVSMTDVAAVNKVVLINKITNQSQAPKTTLDVIAPLHDYHTGKLPEHHPYLKQATAHVSPIMSSVAQLRDRIGRFGRPDPHEPSGVEQTQAPTQPATAQPSIPDITQEPAETQPSGVGSGLSALRRFGARTDSGDKSVERPPASHIPSQVPTAPAEIFSRMVRSPSLRTAAGRIGGFAPIRGTGAAMGRSMTFAGRGLLAGGRVLFGAGLRASTAVVAGGGVSFGTVPLIVLGGLVVFGLLFFFIGVDTNFTTRLTTFPAREEAAGAPPGAQPPAQLNPGPVASGTCPMNNAFVVSGSYNPIEETGHGSTPYWNSVVGRGGADFNCQYPIPGSHIVSGCEGPTPEIAGSTNVCRGREQLCVFYGAALDIDSTSQPKTVFAPNVCPLGETDCSSLTWAVAAVQNTTAGERLVMNGTNQSGSFTARILLLHIDTALAAGSSSIPAGQAVGVLAPISNDHIHIELSINGRPVRPDFLCGA